MSKILFTSFALITITLGLVELDPITEEEKHDEVAQAQERSVWIACLFLAYTHIDIAGNSLASFQVESGHSLGIIKRKVSSSILERCVASITWKEAEEILSSVPGVSDDKFDELAAIDLENFTPELTQAQQALVDKIEKFINLKHEDLFPPPPKTQGQELYIEPESSVWAYYTLAVIPITWILFKLTKSKNTTTQTGSDTRAQVEHGKKAGKKSK